MPTVSIKSENKHFQLEKDVTLFEGLKDCGLELPHACLAGSCGACRVEVTSEEEGLLEAELNELNTIKALKVNYERVHGAGAFNNRNLRLSCQAKVIGNLEIELID